MQAIIWIYTSIAAVQILSLILYIKYPYQSQDNLEIEHHKLENYTKFLKSPTMNHIKTIKEHKYSG